VCHQEGAHEHVVVGHVNLDTVEVKPLSVFVSVVVYVEILHVVANEDFFAGRHYVNVSDVFSTRVAVFVDCRDHHFAFTLHRRVGYSMNGVWAIVGDFV
jgi:hypothetical protein